MAAPWTTAIQPGEPMILHTADKAEIARLAILGAETLQHFRKTGNPVSCKWIPGTVQKPDDACATFCADGVKDSPCNWQGIGLLARMGWHASTPGATWQGSKERWMKGGNPCEPWDADTMEIIQGGKA